MKNIIQYTLVLILFLSVTAFKIYGQYPQSNRMFFQNKFGINVAYAGELEKTRLSLVGNFTSSKIENGGNKWQQLTMDIPLGLDLSTGTRIINNSEGFMAQQIIEQALAYRLYFSRDQTLSFGLSFGINRRTINNKNGLFPNDYVDMNDPIFSTDLLNKNNLRMEVGAVYKQEEFELSLAIPTIIQNNKTLKGITAYAGYNFYPNDDLKITPFTLLMKTYYNNYELTTGTNVEYLEKSWLQLGYVNSKQLLLSLGFTYYHFGLGYNYNLPLDPNFTTMITNSHQLCLYYSF